MALFTCSLIFSVTLYATCSEALHVIIHLIILQMMDCAQESIYEYLLLNKLNESWKISSWQKKYDNNSFKKLLTNITNQRGKEFKKTHEDT